MTIEKQIASLEHDLVNLGVSASTVNELRMELDAKPEQHLAALQDVRARLGGKCIRSQTLHNDTMRYGNRR